VLIPGAGAAPMRVLGIDPGTRHLGWGVVERIGSRVTHVAHGVVDTDEKAPLCDRLVTIDDALQLVLAEHVPTAAAVEGIFFAKDASAAAKLGHARGVVLIRLARAGLTAAEYAPSKVKRAVVGAGLATKAQVAQIVMGILRLPSLPRVDAADALAIALAHLAIAPFPGCWARLGLPPAGGRRRPRRAPGRGQP
jgi:crossover junction endodeoxyribonuclease RuvC